MKVKKILELALTTAGKLAHPRARSSGSRTEPGSRIDPGARTELGVAVDTGGRFLSRVHTSGVGTRAYKVYIPAGYRGEPMPAVVMLHGCTQDPDDFAAGTCMNELADRQHFLVIYPAQSTAANALRCWNWFNTKDQLREGGEPSLIAGITHDVMAEFVVDARRIFITGISAGAAMAVILAETYPELYSAVGAHSGLPYRAAQGMSSALAAMRTGEWTNAVESLAANPVPTIVFHGDQDSRVDVENGTAIVEQAIHRAELVYGPLRKVSHERASTNGREFTLGIYADSRGRPVVENWVVHGGGHAWSGGSENGSYTDPLGPHASAEMVRFFLAQSRTSANVKGALTA